MTLMTRVGVLERRVAAAPFAGLTEAELDQREAVLVARLACVPKPALLDGLSEQQAAVLLAALWRHVPGYEEQE